MPPRKRARVSQAASPEPEPEEPAPATPDNIDEQILNDPWTDDEEIGLFKGLMHWKPTGIHKHSHMINLHAWLLENHYIHPRNEHTKVKGIWTKLEALYNLPALDARENARQLDPEWTSAEQEEEARKEADDDAADVYSIAANKIENEEFFLPGAIEEGDVYEEMMWNARLPKEKSDESDFELPELNLAEQPPTRRYVPSFSIEPSEAATPTSKRSRGGGRGRGSRAAAAADAGSRRRSTRNTESVADKEEDKEEEEEEDAEDGEAEDDDEEGEEEESGDGEEEGEEEEATTTTARRGRSSKPVRGRGAARGRARGRGRGK